MCFSDDISRDISKCDFGDLAQNAGESKKAKYESAVKGLKLKEKSLTTFRWSPLLSLKFPEKLTLEQASEFQFKPMSLQYDIDIAEHNVGDVKLTICNEINTLYVEIVTLQKMLDFNQERADNLEEAVKRNTAKLKVGQATQSDIDTMNSKLKAVNTTIASDRRTLEADLQKLSKKIGMDVTTGYTFESPYIESELTRSNTSHFQALVSSPGRQRPHSGCLNLIVSFSSSLCAFSCQRQDPNRDPG